ncbi:MAG TPA: type II secretion system F family protein [Bacillota bacterium]
MPVFQYRAKEKNGQTITGQLEAVTIRDAAAKLRADGYIITALTPKGLSNSYSGTKSKAGPLGLGGRRVSLKDLVIFTKQLAVLIRAGLNINTCLRILAEQTENKQFALSIAEIRAEVEGGEAFHVALQRRPKIFSAMYVHMVEAGEASGQLETALERLNATLERDFELRKKVKGALTYPAVIAVVATVAVFILMTVVVPTFTQIFEDSGLELPLVTKVLIGTSKFFSQFWYLLLAGLIGLVFGLKFYYNTPQGRLIIEQFLFALAVVGPVIKKVVAARFTRTLATLLDSGVLVTNAMEIVERAVGNTVVAGAINQARISISKGTGIAKPLAETKVFPLMVTQMIAVGEETGELSTMLNNVADFYEKEAGFAIEGLTSLIEPLVIVIMGIVVGIVVAAIAFPMFDLNSGAAL